MTNTSIITLPFLNLEDIVAKGERGDTLSQRELGNLLSRTFGPNIDLLSFARGRMESEDKFRDVTSLNIHARFGDCIEDGNKDKATKLDAFRRLSHIYNKIDLPEVDLEELIRTDLNALIKDIEGGALNKNERIYIEQFGRGYALRELRSFKPSIRNAIAKLCLNPMVNGMSVFTDAGKLDTIKQLKEYCYFVAGTVGEALNRIVQIEDGAILDFNNSRAVGAYVQLTNILKNLREDFNLRSHRIKFLPDEIHEGISYQDLFEKDTAEAIDMRGKVLERLMPIAEEYFQPAMQYIIDIPRKLPGYLAFCSAALLLSSQTQKRIKNSGAERVLRIGEESAIKVSRPTVYNVVSFVHQGVKTDEGIKLINFLNDYRKNTDLFPFEPQEEYEKWSRDYYKDTNGKSSA